MIRKTAGGEYKLVSKSKDAQGKHKNLGTFPTRKAAEKREKQVEYFKHKGK